MSKFLMVLVLLAAAFGAGVMMSGRLHPAAMTEPGSEVSQREPLYWVAPMDPNFRSEKPGKSPMGMDLVPFYADAPADNSQPGTVRISPEVENNLGVRTDVVIHRKLSRVIRTVGEVGFDEDKLHHIHLRVQGWIEKLGVTSAGDAVQRGQVLFELYSPELVTAQEELLIALRSGDRYLRNAARERLGALGFETDQVKTLEKSRKVMRTVVFPSHVDGYLSHLNVRHGMYVRPQTEVMSIGQLDSVWIVAEVPERQSALVAAGQSVKLRFDMYPERTWAGSVDYVYPVLEPKTRSTRVRIRIQNPDTALRPNMYASVEIAAGESHPVLSVPASAVIRSGSMQRVVLALGEGRYRAVEVRAGRRAGDWVEVLEGLAHGDRVVTSAQFLLDSESSRNAEFSRMSAGDAPQSSQPQHAGHEQTQTDHSGHAQHAAPDPQMAMPEMGKPDHDPHAGHRKAQTDHSGHAQHAAPDPQMAMPEMGKAERDPHADHRPSQVHAHDAHPGAAP